MDKCTILFQGDSITDGNRGRTDDPNHILGHSYAYIAASEIGYKYADKNYNFINKGVSGDTADDLYARWQDDCIKHEPDIISILVGINDAAKEIEDTNDIACTDYESTLRLIIEKTTKHLSNTKLILIEPFILDTGNKEKEEYQKLLENIQIKQNIVCNLAKEYDALFIPLQDRFNKVIKIKPASYWIWDSVHPTYAGHGLIANAWLEDTKDLF